jgi:hypothetical protein
MALRKPVVISGSPPYVGNIQSGDSIDPVWLNPPTGTGFEHVTAGVRDSAAYDLFGSANTWTGSVNDFHIVTGTFFGVGAYNLVAAYNSETTTNGVGAFGASMFREVTAIGTGWTAAATYNSFYSNPSVTGTGSNPLVGSLNAFVAAGATIAVGSTIPEQDGFKVAAGVTNGTLNYGFRGLLAADPGSPTSYTARTITNVAVTSNVVTVTTSAAHGFTVGQIVTVGANTNVSINGSAIVIASTPLTTTFTYARTMGNITSGADTGTVTPNQRWNLYMDGAARNYISTVLIGSTTDSLSGAKLQVNGTSEFNGNVSISSTTNYFRTYGGGASLMGYKAGADSGFTASVGFFTGDPGTAANQRWAIAKSAATETGSNVGSNLEIYGYSDTGSFLGTWLSLGRSTGNIGLGGSASASIACYLQGSASGGTALTGYRNVQAVQSDVTTQYVSYHSMLNTLASPFVLGAYYHYLTAVNLRGQASIVTNHYGFITHAMAEGTNNYGYMGQVVVEPGSPTTFANKTISNVAVTSNVVTITTSTAHGYTVGQVVTVNCGTNTQLNGSGITIASTPLTTTFTYALTTANVTSVADTGTVTPNRRWNLYMNGTANNYLNGRLLLGSNTDDGTNQLQVTGTSTFTGQITSTLAIGTAPFAVTSTTKVTNLNSDYLQGLQLGQSGTAIPQLNLSNQWGATQRFNATISVGAAPSLDKSFWSSYATYGGVGTTYGISMEDVAASANTTAYINFRAMGTTSANAFTMVNYYGFQCATITKGAGSTITNHNGFYAADQTDATNVYGFYGNVASGSTKRNLYMVGTAINHLAGALMIGSNTDDTVSKLQVTGDTKLTGKLGLTDLMTFATGTTSLAAYNVPAGTLKTTPVAGDNEFDGVNFYATIDTTSKRGCIPVEQYFHLTADGSNITTTIANFFGTTSNISLVASAYYDIEMMLVFTKTTTEALTITLTNSAAPTSQNIYWEESPASGLVAPPGTATALTGFVRNDATAAKAIVTASLTTATDHYIYIRIQLKNGTGTSLKIQATNPAGSITPRLGSFWRCRRMSPNNVGTFAA